MHCHLSWQELLPLKLFHLQIFSQLTLFFSFSCICHISCLCFYYHSTWGRRFQSLIMLSLLPFLEGLQVAQNLQAERKHSPSPSSLFLCLRASALVLGALCYVPIFRGTLIRQNSASRFPCPLHGAPQHWDTSLHFMMLKPEGKGAVSWNGHLQKSSSRAAGLQHSQNKCPFVSWPSRVVRRWCDGNFLELPAALKREKKRDGKILPRNMPQENSEKSLVAYYGLIQKAFSKL